MKDKRKKRDKERGTILDCCPDCGAGPGDLCCCVIIDVEGRAWKKPNDF